MDKGKIILLNGSSSSGKTSTCRALQDMMEEQYVLLGLDVYSQATPPKQNNMATIESRYFSAEKYLKDGLEYYNISTGPLLDKVICASFSSIAAYLDVGINVISDQLFWSPLWFQAALNAFIPYKVFFVGLFVSDAEGLRRELQRSQAAGAHDIQGNGRPGGWNRTSALVTHQNMIYDFSIDNTHLSIQETAKRIKEAFEATSNPTAWKNLHEIFKQECNFTQN
ncbi:phosphotransferase-like protein [Legionella sp. WA2022007384]